MTEQEKEKLVKQVDMALRCLGKHAAVLIKLVSSAKPQPSAVPPTTAIGVICEMERFVGEKEGACAVLTSTVALEGTRQRVLAETTCLVGKTIVCQQLKPTRRPRGGGSGGGNFYANIPTRCLLHLVRTSERMYWWKGRVTGACRHFVQQRERLRKGGMVGMRVTGQSVSKLAQILLAWKNTTVIRPPTSLAHNCCQHHHYHHFGDAFFMVYLWRTRERAIWKWPWKRVPEREVGGRENVF